MTVQLVRVVPASDTCYRNRSSYDDHEIAYQEPTLLKMVHKFSAIAWPASNSGVQNSKLCSNSYGIVSHTVSAYVAPGLDC